LLHHHRGHDRIVWLNPDIVVVYDRAASAAAGEFKRFNLVVMNTPSIQGRTAVIANNGQVLTVQSLLPATATISEQRLWTAYPAQEVNQTSILDTSRDRLVIEVPANPLSTQFLTVLQGSDVGAQKWVASALHSTAGLSFDGAVVAAVGDDDAFGTAGLEALGAAAGHVASPEEHDLAVAEVAEDFFGEFDGDGADGSGAALDLGVVADVFADAEGFLEEFVEFAGGGAGGMGGGVGVLDLAEDFSLAENHGVEAAGDGVEVAGGVLVGVLEEFDIAGDVKAGAQPGIEVAGGGGGGGAGSVDFHAVAGGDDDSFINVRKAGEGLDGGGQVFAWHGDTLADFHGGAGVAEAEAEKHGADEGMKGDGMTDRRLAGKLAGFSFIFR
jgi:hypothetical protein